jgi:hypothetical protein
LNTQDEAATTVVAANKARRVSLEQTTRADDLEEQLDVKQKKSSENIVQQLKVDIKKCRLKFEIQTTELQRNCDDLLTEFKDCCSKEKEDAVAISTLFYCVRL